jgi:membrane associated rhomboid family serine protease
MPDRQRTMGRSYVYGYLPPGVKWLLISNSAIFVIYWIGGQALQSHVNTLFALIPAAVVDYYYIWQPFTYLFLHASIGHIVLNMLALYFFGSPLELDWGTRRFLKFYFYCGIAAGVCVLLAGLLAGGRDLLTPTLGASGAILGLLVAFGVLHPNEIILLMFMIPMKAKHLVMLYAAIEFLQLWGGNPGVSTMAHLGGMAFAFLYLKVKIPNVSGQMPDWRGRYRQWKMQRAKKKFQVYMKKHGRGGPFVN